MVAALVTGLCSCTTDKVSTIDTKMDSELQTSRTSLSIEEQHLFQQINTDNEAILFPNLRESRQSTIDSSVVTTSYHFDKDSLAAKGYIYLNFTSVQEASKLYAYYEFSQGQAFWGYGTAILQGDNIIHTVYTCGMSNRSVQVYINGKKSSEQSLPNKI
jgi:hypothetical protein